MNGAVDLHPNIKRGLASSLHPFIDSFCHLLCDSKKKAAPFIKQQRQATATNKHDG